MAELNQGFSLGWNKTVVKYTHGNVDATGDGDTGDSKLGDPGAQSAEGKYSGWGTNTRNAYRWSLYNFGETHFTDNFGMFHLIAGSFASGYDESVYLDWQNGKKKEKDLAFQFVVRPYYKLTKMTKLIAELGLFTNTEKYFDNDDVNKQQQKVTLAYAYFT